MSWSSKRLCKKNVAYCCFHLNSLFWLPGTALPAYQNSLFCATLNTPNNVLLDSGNRLTFDSAAPQKSFTMILHFLSSELLLLNISWCKVPFWNQTAPIPWAQKGCAGHCVTARAVRARYLISTHSLKVVRYHLSPRVDLGCRDCKHIPVDT